MLPSRDQLAELPLLHQRIIAVFVAALRLRLGLPLADAPSTCRLCHVVEADVHGHHTLCCLHLGMRTRAHDRLRNEVQALAKRSLLTPGGEARPFSTDPGARMDVVLVKEGVFHLLDTAIIFPLALQHRTHAATKSGGAATNYEAKKHQRYGPVIAREPNPAAFKLIPLVVDMFGAWGDAALPAITVLAHAWALRVDLPRSVAISLAFHRLNFTVIKAVASLATTNQRPRG